jgi:hypothetical protein
LKEYWQRPSNHNDDGGGGGCKLDGQNNAFISNCTCNERKEDWKPFRNALDKSDRKEFDEMSDLPKWYISACSNSVQYVRLHPIVMSILFHHYKEMKECISEVERIETTVYTENKRVMVMMEEDEKEEVSTTLDNFLSNKLVTCSRVRLY